MSCKPTSQILCTDNNCETCFKRSFANSLKSKLWSDNNQLKPRNVFMNSNSQYFLNCNKCNHEYQTTLNRFS